LKMDTSLAMLVLSLLLIESLHYTHFRV